jgi:hypothetical protein
MERECGVRRSGPKVWFEGPQLVIVLSLILGTSIAAQQPASSVPDLEGGWVRIDVDGSGSFNALAAKFPRAVLTPAAQTAAAEQAKRAAQPRFDFARDPSKPRAAGEGYVVTDGSCTLPGGVEPNSAAFHVVQSKDQVLIVRENPGLPRTIYMDDRAHPDLSRVAPNAAGHSTGRYDAGSLLVETIGLTQGNVTAGGWRTPETRLTERYRLSPDGQRLTITYTWEDPRVYVKPHTYQIVAERTPPGSWAFESWCDSSDPSQRLSIVPPQQNK